MSNKGVVIMNTLNCSRCSTLTEHQASTRTVLFEAVGCRNSQLLFKSLIQNKNINHYFMNDLPSVPSAIKFPFKCVKYSVTLFRNNY